MAQKTNKQENRDTDMPFSRKNYQLLLISMVIVVIGFLLMIGDTDIYDVRKTFIAPVVVVGGFAFGIYAVLKK